MNKKGLIVISVITIICIFFVACNKANKRNNSKQDNELQGKQELLSCIVIGVDESGKQIDSIMIASLNYSDETVSVLAVPSDIRCVKEKYANMITSNNLEKIVGDISAACNIDVDKYIVLTLETVSSILSEFGNITFDIPDLYGDGVGMVYDDNIQNLHISLSPGRHKLTPEEMMHVIRYIKGNLNSEGRRATYDNGEIDRLYMQQSLIKSIFEQKSKILEDTNVLSIIKTFPSKLKTNLTSKDIVEAYKLISNIEVADIFLKTMQGQYLDDGYIKYFEPQIQ